ncbi:MAG: ATP synthase F0 subunit A, partial [Lachnospiraceae bacterium]
MGLNILLSAGADIDFMIHGIFSYEFFGHTVWITTTHVCVLIVLLALVIFSIAAGRTMKRAEQVPAGF